MYMDVHYYVTQNIVCDLNTIMIVLKIKTILTLNLLIKVCGMYVELIQ